MQQASRELAVAVRWGGAWVVDNIATWPKSMEEAMNYYIDMRSLAGKKPFLDGPHFELV